MSGLTFDPFLALLQAHKLPAPQTEFVFAPPRRFRADYAWPDRLVIVERNGGIFAGNRGAARGRHNWGTGILADMEKANLAQLGGWLYLQYTPRQLDKGEALEQLKAVLG